MGNKRFRVSFEFVRGASRSWPVCLAQLLIFGACEAASFPDYPVRPANNYLLSVTKSGFTIAAHPLTDSKEQATYFGLKLIERGYLPVFIVARNNSARDSFLLTKDTISHHVSGESAAGLLTPEVHSKAGNNLVIADAAAGAVVAIGGAVAAGAGGGGNPVPLGLIGLDLVSKAADIQHNLLKKELQSKTLSPGASTHGFLYVRAPENLAKREIHLQISIAPLNAEEPIRFNLMIHPSPLK